MSQFSTNGTMRQHVGDQFDDPTAEILRLLDLHHYDPRPTGQGMHKAYCPGHGSPDENDGRNLQISTSDDGECLLHCFAHECTLERILEPLGLKPFHVFRPKSKAVKPSGPGFENGNAVDRFLRKSGWKLTYYIYTDDFAVFRYDTPNGKKCYPVSRNVDGLWRVQDPASPLPL